MSLIPSESGRRVRRVISPSFRAFNDPVLFKDERVLKTLLRKEHRYVPQCPNYFLFVQRDIKSHMRKDVADWMLAICEEQQSHPEVFCLAMNYFDRFLSLCSIGRNQIQLLGAVCLMVAWKVREDEALPAIRLVEYSDLNISLLDIMEWEVLLLSKLDWDMSAVIASDFIEHFIHLIRKVSPALDLEMTRRHSETLITMCSAHHSFYALSASLLASAAVLTAARPILEALEPFKDGSSSPTSSSTSTSSSLDMLEHVLEYIEKVTQISKSCIIEVMDRIEILMRASLPPSPSSTSPNSSQDYQPVQTLNCEEKLLQSPHASPEYSPRVLARRNNNNPGEDSETTPTKVLDVATKNY